MKTVTVNASKKYDILIAEGLMEKAGEHIRGIAPNSEKAAVITDDSVAPLYAGKLEKSLIDAGFSVCRFTLPHGEASKNAENYIKILNFLAENQITRTDLVVALGGGVVGDISGFASATFLRGVKYIQIPTTLLAMVDSSVGGKTAIDLETGKNLAGAFYQPSLVLCDLTALETLPVEIFTDGCAEVLKYGVLGDRELFDHLIDKGREFDREYVVTRCVEMKRDYVCEDEFDTGIRRELNLGHTVGHAVEKCSNFTVSHGSAVAIGMTIIAKASAEKGICDISCAEEIEKGLKILGLPTKTDFTADELLPAMLSDKKRTGGTVSFIVPKLIGKCEVYPMPVSDISDFVKAGL